jgi:hypothetical protein
VVGCHECGDEPSGSGGMELVSYKNMLQNNTQSLVYHTVYT